MPQNLNALTLADRELRQVTAELRAAARAYATLARLLEADDPSAVARRFDSEPGLPLRTGPELDPSRWPDRKDVLALVARQMAARKAFDTARRKVPADGFHMLDLHTAA